MTTRRSALLRRVTATALVAGLALLAGGRDDVAHATSSEARVVVELEVGSSAASLSTLLGALHWEVAAAPSRHLAEGSGLGDVVLVRPAGILASATSIVLAALAASSVVTAAEEDFAFAGDTYGGEQSQVPVFLDDLHLAQMRTQPAFVDSGIAPPGSASGSGVRVAVLDGGFRLDHEAIAGRCDDGFDVLGADSDPEDAGNGVDDDADGVVDGGVGHGTAVAALIAVSDPDAVIIPVRVLDDEGRGSLFSVATGLRYALDANARVVNMSLGAPHSSCILDSALSAAHAADVLVVASAGNGGDSNVTYPATHSAVVGVTGVTEDGLRDDVASIGPTVDASAPSVDVVAPFPGTSSGYGHWYGTSFACALFSAAAARVLEVSSNGPLVVGEELLEATAAFPSAAAPDSDDMGSGILDASTLVD